MHPAARTISRDDGSIASVGGLGKAALYLAADATWMTGHTMVIDGGELVRVEPFENQ